MLRLRTACSVAYLVEGLPSKPEVPNSSPFQKHAFTLFSQVPVDGAIPLNCTLHMQLGLTNFHIQQTNCDPPDQFFQVDLDSWGRGVTS